MTLAGDNLLALSQEVTGQPRGYLATTQLTISWGRGPGFYLQKLPQMRLITKKGGDIQV